MATTYFHTYSITASDFTSSSGKTLYTSTLEYTFPTNILSAGVSIQKFNAATGDSTQPIGAVGAGVEAVQYSGSTITYKGYLNLQSHTNKLKASDCALDILICANCE